MNISSCSYPWVIGMMILIATMLLFGGWKAPIDENISDQTHGKGTHDLTTQSDASVESIEHQCSIYMALSNIPNAGFGVFTTRDIQKGDFIFPYPDAPSIPMCDTERNGLEEHVTNHFEYVWSGSGQAEFECDQVCESVVTLGALINYHTTLKNVEPVNTGYDDTLVHSSSPGAGAFSYYSGHKFEATADIKAGSEIFGNYGENWLDSRKGTYADYVPRQNDFKEAFKVFKILHRDFEKHSVPITDALIGSFADIVKHFDTRIGNAFPKTVKQFQELQRRQYEGLYPGAILLGHVMLGNDRDSNWIKENGVCLENIRPGKSTIADAGRGAFANRFMPKGSIVSPAPLLNVVDRSKLNIVHRGNNNSPESEDEGLLSQQLLINYCFSRVDSSLVLCPQTNAILINHCSKRMKYGGECGENGPNAVIRWATNWDKDTEKWLNMTLEEIAEKTEDGSRGLSLEIIATRDIQPNEEIFIDYGENWEQAWNEHSEFFKNEPKRKEYPSMRSLIKAKDFRTVHQQETNPYPDHIQTVCIYPDAGYDEFPDDGSEIEKLGSSYVSEDDMDSQYHVFPCHILEKQFHDVKRHKTSKYQRGGFKTNTTYSVRVFLGPNHDNQTVVLTQYPEESISFRVRKYKSAQHNPRAFRHFMEISDDLFPGHWKDISPK